MTLLESDVALKTSGLTERDVQAARARYGPNVIAPSAKRTGAIAWVWRILSDPMSILLIVAAAVYLGVGDRVDAIVALVALVPIVAVSVVLERRADAALAALRALTAPRARVVRAGVTVVIPAEEIVPGDRLVLREGDVIGADAALVEGDLRIDEASLTGESIPVDADGERAAPVFAGTTVVGGSACGVVSATGAKTRAGAIARTLGEIHPPHTPIERTLRALMLRIGAAVLLLCAVVAVTQVLHGVVWSAAVIAAVSLGMAAMPEEMPVVYTLYLALGAWRLARDRALVRRLASVETLGAVSTICVDKTGTITLGRVALATVVPLDGVAADEVVRVALFASDPASADPLDQALAHAGHGDPRPGARLIDDVPYDARRRYAARTWEKDGTTIRASKGAVEALAAFVDKDAARAAAAENQRLAAQGLRVLAVSAAYGDAPPRLLGFVGFRDPIRGDAPASLAECRSAAVRVVMITGDHPATAAAIAADAGFGSDSEHVVSGDQLDGMSEAELDRLVDGTRVFARTRPEQKLAIVRALRRLGHVVAMTGDGTNDALALKEADIGIAMGERGTEVAREAAALVLLNDDLSTIVRAIRDGRRIFDNLRRAFGYLVGFHVPLLLAGVAIPVLGLPLLLQPIHLVWLELIVHPVSSLVFEGDPADPDVMRRPPRSRREGLLRPGDWLRSGALGLALALAVVAFYAVLLRSGYAAEVARGAAFIALFVGQSMLVFVQRAGEHPIFQAARPEPIAFALAGAAVGTLALVFAIPSLAAVLHLAPPPLTLAGEALAIGLATTLWLEPFKR